MDADNNPIPQYTICAHSTSPGYLPSASGNRPGNLREASPTAAVAATANARDARLRRTNCTCPFIGPCLTLFHTLVLSFHRPLVSIFDLPSPASGCLRHLTYLTLLTIRSSISHLRVARP